MKEAKDLIQPGERIQIVNNYRALLRACAPIMEKDDVSLIRKALEVTVPEERIGERRASGNLSIIHSLEVALIVINEIGLGRTAVICALLYDAVLDKKITSDEVEKIFGSQAAGIVKGLVKVHELYARNTSIKNENFRKIWSVCIIKEVSHNKVIFIL